MGLLTSMHKQEDQWLAEVKLGCESVSYRSRYGDSAVQEGGVLPYIIWGLRGTDTYSGVKEVLAPSPLSFLCLCQCLCRHPGLWVGLVFQMITRSTMRDSDQFHSAHVRYHNTTQWVQLCLQLNSPAAVVAVQRATAILSRRVQIPAINCKI